MQITMEQQKATVIPAISQPRLLLHLEGLTVFIGAIVAYAYLGGNGWMFAALLLVPDVGMVGYLVNKEIGATLYNIVHFYGTPALIIVLALAGGSMLGLQIGLIWLAHNGMDRIFGYGLKYATEFKDTHLGRV